MTTVTLSEHKLNKVLTDVENLIEGVADLLNEEDIVKKQIKDIESSQFTGKSEKQLDNYLKKRGIKID